MAHTASSQPGAGSRRAMSAETMKMPEPIIEPATNAVASRRPSRASRPPGSALTSPPPREADRRARHARAPAGRRHRLHRRRDLGRGLHRHRRPHGDRERVHPAPLGDHHAVRGLSRVPRRARADRRRARRRRRLRARLARRLRRRRARRAAGDRALGALRPARPPRAGARRALVRALGPGDGLLGASPPRRAHLHRAPGGDRADGALALRVAHLRGLAPLVLGARLRGLQAGGELERGAREDARLRHGGRGARRPRVGGGARAPPARTAHRPAPASARALARAASASHEGEARTSSSERTFLLEPERRFRETRSHANAPSRSPAGRCGTRRAQANRVGRDFRSGKKAREGRVMIGITVAILLALLATDARAGEQTKPFEGFTKYVKYHVRYEVNPDGTHVETHDWALKVLSDQGVSAANSASVSFSDRLQEAEILSAYTLKKDGRRIDVPASNFQEESNTGNGEASPMFSDIKTKTVA